MIQRLGADLVQQSRTSIADAVAGTLQGFIDQSPLNIWEFTHKITNKPTSDPKTWDWTPALQAAIDQVSNGAGLDPSVSGGCILFPAQTKGFIYKITEIEIPLSVCLTGQGATIQPFNPADTRTHLFKFLGMNKVFGLQIAMQYSLTYKSCIWFGGRNIDLNTCAVWFSKMVIYIGEPLWETDPTKAWLGYSEVSVTNCQFNWCLRVCTAVGLNTIITFGGGSRCYSNPTIPDNHPNKTAWAALPRGNFDILGALVYLGSAFMGTFERDVPSVTLRCIQVSESGYNNSFGRIFCSNTHIETSMLCYAPSPTGFTSEDEITKCLVLNNCGGHVANSNVDGFFINMSSQLKQGISIRQCFFYSTHGTAPTRTKIITAPQAWGDIEESSFTCYAGEFKDACLFYSPKDAKGIMFANVFGSTQTIGASGSNLVMPSNGTIDLHNNARGMYYANSTGVFTAVMEMHDVDILLDLRYTSGGSSLLNMTVEAVVGGVTQDTIVMQGAFPRGRLRIRRLTKGQTFTIKCTASADVVLTAATSKMQVCAST